MSRTPTLWIVSRTHELYHRSLSHEFSHGEMGNISIFWAQKRAETWRSMASVGPMGLGAIDYALHCENAPKLLVVTDINEERLARAASIYTVEAAQKLGIELHYVNTAKPGMTEYMMQLSGGKGYDDILIFAPVESVIQQASDIIGVDGCMNFFAGPIDHAFSAKINFYKVHYNRIHICGNSGGNADDMQEALDMAAAGRINPASMVTHVGGLDSVVDTILHLPEIPGGQEAGIQHDLHAHDSHCGFWKAGGNQPHVPAVGRDLRGA